MRPNFHLASARAMQDFASAVLWRPVLRTRPRFADVFHLMQLFNREIEIGQAIELNVQLPLACALDLIACFDGCGMSALKHICLR